MTWNRICLMLPTYGRSGTKLRTFVESAVATIANPDQVCFSFCVNENDQGTLNYLTDYAMEHPAVEIEIITENLPKPHLAKFWNMIDEKSRFMDERTMLSMVGDDMIFRTKGWDNIVLSWCNAFNGIGLFYGDDCYSAHESLSVYHFITRQFRDAIKPLPYMCEDFAADQVDVIWHETAKRIGRLFYIPSLRIFHNHYGIKGNVDATTVRLRTEAPDQKAIEEKQEPYIVKCVELMKKNLGDQLKDENIDVIITTKDRLELLRTTVSSYRKSIAVPKKVEVFDDNSSDRISVGAQIANLPTGFQLHWSDETVGCNAKTPAVLKKKFNSGAEAVFILDSDTLLSEYWWIRANCMYRQMKNDKSVAAFSLFHCDQFGEKASDHPMCVEQGAIGAFGSLITKEYYEGFIVPAIAKDPQLSWDAQASLAAVAAGKKILVSAPSFLQHTGSSLGAHVGGSHPAYATDFVDRMEIESDVELSSRVGKAVLFGCFGRHGDIIHASFYANRLVADGYDVGFLTSPYHETLAHALCPKVRIVIGGCEVPDCDYEYTDVQKMSSSHPGYGFYINAQISSPAHHGRISSAAVPVLGFMRDYISTIMGYDLDFEVFKKIEFVPTGSQHQNKAICIVGIDHNKKYSQWSEAELSHVVSEFSPQYDVKLLSYGNVAAVPREMRRRRIKVNTFLEACHAMNGAQLYIGKPSGLTWAATLYRGMKKRVYHDLNEDGQIRFVSIDQSAEDVIPESFMHPSVCFQNDAFTEEEMRSIVENLKDASKPLLLKPNQLDNLHLVKIPISPADDTGKKVVSFSVWGENPSYIVGMQKNIDLVKTFYPGWTCRIYCTSFVAERLRTIDKHVEVEIRQDEGWGGLFWRFEPACNPSIDRVLVRDADSRPSEREVAAVKEWELSRLPFHNMRDHIAHGVPILGGMWGIIPRMVPEFRAKFLARTHQPARYGVDQEWLRDEIWPIVAKCTLTHDDAGRYPESGPKKFPRERKGEFDFVGNKMTENDLPVFSIQSGVPLR